MAKRKKKLKRYTLYDPNGDERYMLAKNKGEALKRATKSVGRGKKTQFAKDSEIVSGWDYD